MRLIDANALIDNVYESLNENPHSLSRDRTIHKHEHEHFLVMIEHTPTIDPESLRPQGEWIYHIDDLFPAEGTQECSNCHQEEKISLCNENYCPNCGAKMTTMDGDADGTA